VPHDSSQRERGHLEEPAARAWRMPALLAVVLLGAGAGLLWVAGRMTPTPTPPEVVPPSTPPTALAQAAVPTTTPAAASRPTAMAAQGGDLASARTAAAPAAMPGATPAPTPAAASAGTPGAAPAPTPAAAPAPTPAAAPAGTPGAAPAPTPAAAPAPTPAAAPAPAPDATPAPTPGAKTPIIAVKGSAVTCFEPQSDSDKPTGRPCTSQQLRGRLLDHTAEIESCLAAVPAGKRPARGTIALRGRWSLGDPPAGGKLARLRALRNAPKDPAFLRCVRSELSMMHVKSGVCPRCYAEMTVTISY
jgi:hypothetical protein